MQEHNILMTENMVAVFLMTAIISYSESRLQEPLESSKAAFALNFAAYAQFLLTTNPFS